MSKHTGVARFAIGTKFVTRGKHPRECTVTDILRTLTFADMSAKLSLSTVAFSALSSGNFRSF